mmetsp:Transcript_39032/g.79907  ORF Transcript_39032/g.79907 Transcript_39032/m.79907 type:complete len:444 (+) Transcript_39032:387-1718(+)
MARSAAVRTGTTFSRRHAITGITTSSTWPSRETGSELLATPLIARIASPFTSAALSAQRRARIFQRASLTGMCSPAASSSSSSTRSAFPHTLAAASRTGTRSSLTSALILSTCGASTAAAAGPRAFARRCLSSEVRASVCPCRRVHGPSLSSSELTWLDSSSSSSTLAEWAPYAAAACMRKSSSSSVMSSWREVSAEATTPAETAFPALPSAASSASMWLSLPAPSDVLTPANKSLMSGSTRVIMVTSCAKPRTERARTSFECSLSDLTKVVWSCGRKGFIMTPPFWRRRSSVLRMAALTWEGKRSPMMRMRGPLIWTTMGLSAASLVHCTSSPSPTAACSRVSGVAPCMSAWRKKGSSGASPLVRLKPGTPLGGAAFASSFTSSSTVLTCTPQLTEGAFASSLFSEASMLATRAARAACAFWSTGSSSAPKRWTRPLTISGL